MTTHWETPDPQLRDQALALARKRRDEQRRMADEVFLGVVDYWSQPYEVCDDCLRSVDECRCELDEYDE